MIEVIGEIGLDSCLINFTFYFCFELQYTLCILAIAQWI